MADYQCKDCEEVFENKIQALIHHVATKHQNYDIMGTDVQMIVKS